MKYIKAKGVGWYERELSDGMIESLTLTPNSTSIALRDRSLSGNNLAKWRRISFSQYMKVRELVINKFI